MVVDVRDPVAHRFVDRVLQRPAAGVDALDRRAEQAHAEDVQRLPRHVLRAHVDDALEAEQRAGRRRGDAVLPRAGLGDDAALAHALREQRLAERVVDLVRAGVREILALEEEAHARVARRAPRLVERRRPADVGRRAARFSVADELGIAPRGEVRRRRAPRPAPSASRARTGRRTRRSSRARPDRAGRTPGPAWRALPSSRCPPWCAAAKNAGQRSALLIPGSLSTPDETSTAHGRTPASPSATLPAIRPPASMIGRRAAIRAARSQSATWPVPPRSTGLVASTSGVVDPGSATARSTSSSDSAGTALISRAPTAA